MSNTLTAKERETLETLIRYAAEVHNSNIIPLYYDDDKGRVTGFHDRHVYLNNRLHYIGQLAKKGYLALFWAKNPETKRRRHYIALFKDVNGYVLNLAEGARE